MATASCCASWSDVIRCHGMRMFAAEALYVPAKRPTSTQLYVNGARLAVT